MVLSATVPAPSAAPCSVRRVCDRARTQPSSPSRRWPHPLPENRTKNGVGEERNTYCTCVRDEPGPIVVPCLRAAYLLTRSKTHLSLLSVLSAQPAAESGFITVGERVGEWWWRQLAVAEMTQVLWLSSKVSSLSQSLLPWLSSNRVTAAAAAIRSSFNRSAGVACYPCARRIRLL